MGLVLTSVEEFRRREPTEVSLENLPPMVAMLRLTVVELGGRRLKEGGIEKGDVLAMDWK